MEYLFSRSSDTSSSSQQVLRFRFWQAAGQGTAQYRIKLRSGREHCERQHCRQFEAGVTAREIRPHGCMDACSAINVLFTLVGFLLALSAVQGQSILFTQAPANLTYETSATFRFNLVGANGIDPCGQCSIQCKVSAPHFREWRALRVGELGDEEESMQKPYFKDTCRTFTFNSDQQQGLVCIFGCPSTEDRCLWMK